MLPIQIIATNITWITQETRFDLWISGIPSADISLMKYSSVYSLLADTKKIFQKLACHKKMKWPVYKYRCIWCRFYSNKRDQQCNDNLKQQLLIVEKGWVISWQGRREDSNKTLSKRDIEQWTNKLYQCLNHIMRLNVVLEPLSWSTEKGKGMPLIWSG